MTANTPKTLKQSTNTTTEASIIIANAMVLTEQASKTKSDSCNSNGVVKNKDSVVSFQEKLASVNEHIALVQQLINEFKEQQVRDCVYPDRVHGNDVYAIEYYRLEKTCAKS